MIQPRICMFPACAESLGQEAVDLAASAGVILDDWQALPLRKGLGVRPDRKWASFENAVNTPRQNGKNEIALVRELAGLFLFGERLLIHSAHEFKTSTEHQRRVEEVIQNTPELHKRVKPRGYKHSHGEESIELRTGQRIRFMTRTKGGGRGHTGDLVVFDEAMILQAAMLGALMPTLSARSVHGNPQLWYFGTAVDQLIQEHGVVFARLRARALAGDDPSLAYFEWSANVGDPREDSPDRMTVEQLDDRGLWREANPAEGIRISEEHIANERRSMDARTFAVERDGVGDWPSLDGDRSVIDMAVWVELADAKSQPVDPVCLAFDVRPDRSFASIAAAGFRTDSLAHVEVVDHRRGTGWLPGRVAEIVRGHAPAAVVTDSRGPGASLLPELEQLGVHVDTVSASEYAAGCGHFFDAVDQRRLRHLGSQELEMAVRNAAKRPLGEAWAWSRKGDVDISPLSACTLALWKASQGVDSVYERRDVLTFSLG